QRARVFDNRLAFEIGAGKKMRLCGYRREFVALDRKAKKRHARRGWVWHAGSVRLRDRDPKQTPVSLRDAERQRNLNPAASGHRDCFAALAMTASVFGGWTRGGHGMPSIDGQR